MNAVKFSLEVPIAHLHEVEPEVDFHFMIATTAVKHPKYLDYYKSAAAKYRENKSTQYVMMDNGAFEANASGTTPVPMTCEDIFELAMKVRPQIVWVPDHPYNQKITDKLMEEWLQLYSKYAPDFQFGFIPQGRTAEEIANSFVKFEGYAPWMGLSFLNDRDAVMRLLGRRVVYKKIHMLGISELIEIKTWPRMPLTTDTSKPIKAAFLGKYLEQIAKGEGLLLPDNVVEEKELMLDNIRRFRSYCRGEL